MSALSDALRELRSAAENAAARASLGREVILSLVADRDRGAFESMSAHDRSRLYALIGIWDRRLKELEKP